MQIYIYIVTDNLSHLRPMKPMNEQRALIINNNRSDDALVSTYAHENRRVVCYRGVNDDNDGDDERLRLVE